MTATQFPQAFIKREQPQLGTQWDEFERAHQQPPPVSIRYNPFKTKPPFTGTPVPWAACGVYLDHRPSFTLDPSFHGGKYYVQEASSMFLEQAFRQLIPTNHGIRVLDLCAAPGGKSTHLLSLLNADSLLVSNEVIHTRTSSLLENIRKWGNCNVVVTNNDAKDFQRLEGFFDVIVVDAPCSGEGLFRKDPAALKEWSEENVALCSKRQRRILNDVWPALKTDGVLIYSTCTYSAEENEDNLIQLKEGLQFKLMPINLDPEWQMQVVGEEQATGYRFFPHKVRGEGFSLFGLRKLKETTETELSAKSKFTTPPPKLSRQLSEWIVAPDEKLLVLNNDRVQFFPNNRLTDLQMLLKNLRVLSAGTPMATIKHEKLIPDHGLALSSDLNRKSFDVYELDKESALQYLRKNIPPIQTQRKGYALVTFEDVALGWINVLDNRLNNLYPSDWRIRIS